MKLTQLYYVRLENNYLLSVLKTEYYLKYKYSNPDLQEQY